MPTRTVEYDFGPDSPEETEIKARLHKVDTAYAERADAIVAEHAKELDVLSKVYEERFEALKQRYDAERAPLVQRFTQIVVLKTAKITITERDNGEDHEQNGVRAEESSIPRSSLN